MSWKGKNIQKLKVRWLINNEDVKTYLDHEGFKTYDKKFFEMIEKIVPGSSDALITPSVLGSSIDRAKSKDLLEFEVFLLFDRFKEKYPIEFEAWIDDHPELIQEFLFGISFYDHRSIMEYISKIENFIPDAFTNYFDYEKFVDALIYKWSKIWHDESESEDNILLKHVHNIIQDKYPDRIDEFEVFVQRLKIIKKKNPAILLPKRE